MKSIIFHYSIFNQGGAEKSTMRLMNLFLKNGWDVTLLLNFGGGVLESELPKEIKIVHLAKNSIEKYKASFIKKVFYRFIDATNALKVLKRLKNKNFDIACVGLQGLNPKIICNKIKANKKFLFIRNDISKVKAKPRIVKNVNKYKDKLDNLICVSNTAKESIIDAIPAIKDNAVVIYNVIEKENMLLKLNEAENPYKDKNAFNVVTVCRMLDSAKGLMRSLTVYKKLLEEGYKFNWYFVGDGKDLSKMKEYIKGTIIENYISFEGSKPNPFPYYKYASLVAVLSYHEGLCGVVNEAKISGNAVIATEFSGVHEQLTNGVNGYIVDNNEEAIYKGLKYLLDNKDFVEKIKNNIYPESILNDNYKYEQLIAL